MSIEIMSMVWKNAELRGGDRLVLLALADNANDEGICWPSLNTIAGKANISRRSALRSVEKLIADGYLIRSRRTRPNGSHTSNYYLININTLVTPRHHPSDAHVTTPSDAHVTTLVTPTSPPESSLEPPLRKVNETNAKVLSFTDSACERLFCEVTGLFTIPNTQRLQNDFAIIRGLLSKHGIEKTREILTAWWLWWIAGKTQKGIPYNRTNTAWLDKAQLGDMPGVIPHQIGITQSGNGSISI